MKTHNYPKLIIGFFLVFLGVFVWSRNYNSQPFTNTSLANEPVKFDGFDIGDISERPVKILIPSVNIDLDIKLSKVINGYWEVYNDSAGWGEGSGQPGQVGNQVVFAHATDSLFGSLKNINKDSNIYILAKKERNDGKLGDTDTWYHYHVVDIKEVYPNQTDVIKPTDDETLTLYTCSGFKDTKRLVVIAKR